MGAVTVEPGTQLDVDPAGGGLIRLHGELDIRTCVKLEQVVGVAVDEGRRVVLDLAELTFCDSTGLAGLVRLHKRAQAAGGELVLRDPVPRVQTLLGLTGLDRLFPIESTV
ncbi:anti-sigma factor antagonist [Virgisporangium aliadipatigenens]|uniref:Anti-sigma factor antagonist n=1 Tax=Virgisporangium aliadipatigenens TaxID=741659 RepID=A0A8J3YQ40_9ACTN|nr:anti-sigma factor antagonist [Virgisporangium aliadipatigenens]